MKSKIFIIIILSSFFLTACSIEKTEQIKDNKRFAIEYEVPKENPFAYINSKEAIDILKANGIIYFAESDSEKNKIYTKILLDSLKYYNIEKINYFNIVADKKDITKEYEEILELIKDTLIKDKYGNDLFITPSIYIIKDGVIINHHKLHIESLEKIYDKKEQQKIKKEIQKIFNEYQQ